MNKVLKWVLLGTAVYVGWKALKASGQPKMKLVAPIPEGAVKTGRIKTTPTGAPPDQVSEIVVSDPKSYVEFRKKDGTTEWVLVEAFS